MSYLTSAERFKDARTVHNQHGKQDQATVSLATGIAKGTICEIEKDQDRNGNPFHRELGGDKVAKLADYYGVSGDYLLGLSDDPSTKPKAVDELGIPLPIVDFFLKLKETNNQDRANVVFQILCADEFQALLSNIQTYIAAKKAASIFSDIESKYNSFGNDNDKFCDFAGKTIEQISKLPMDEKLDIHIRFRDHISEMILNEVAQIVERNEYSDMINWALMAQCQIYGGDQCRAKEMRFFLSGGFTEHNQTIVNICEKNAQESFRSILEKLANNQSSIEKR